VFIVSGSGVGGGSLGYANTLYRARPEFFNDDQWAGLADWDSELGPHYETAERMLGVTTYEGLDPADELLREYGGSDGYAVTSRRSGAWLSRRRERTVTAGGVVFAAGALGTNQLLAECRHSGSLPRLSDRIGHVVRTNSESIQAVTAPDDERDFAASVAITSSIYPDPDTHIEVVSYGQGGDLMSRLFTAATGPGTRVTRPLKWIVALLRHPLGALRMLWPFGWSRRTIILLVMQTTDAAMRLVPKRRLL
jgi:cholesterol oxidase